MEHTESTPRTRAVNRITARKNLANEVTPEFIRFDEGAVRYCMSKKKFRELAYAAKAVYVLNQVCIVNRRMFDEYLESFRIV